MEKGEIYGQCVHGYNLVDCTDCEEMLRSDVRLKNNGWMKVEIDMPEKQLGVSVYIESQDLMTTAFYDESNKWFEPYTYTEVKDITHWMELPNSPKEK